jgi:hypothetical protein
VPAEDLRSRLIVKADSFRGCWDRKARFLCWARVALTRKRLR